MVPQLHMEHNTAYVQMFAGRIFRKCPIGEDFTILFSQRPILPEDFVNRVCYHVAITVVREVLVHLLSDLSCYYRCQNTADAIMSCRHAYNLFT